MLLLLGVTIAQMEEISEKEFEHIIIRCMLWQMGSKEKKSWQEHNELNTSENLQNF